MQHFRADPYCFGKSFFEQKSSERPQFSVYVAEALAHFAETYCDENRSSSYEQFPEGRAAPLPSTEFPQSIPSIDLFRACLRKARNGSAPGPVNGIPYTVWKNCPSLQHRLYTICCIVWQSAKVPEAWCEAIIILLHKSGDNKAPKNFRPIFLSNCDGEMFFSLVASRVTTYLRNNNYFDGETQKGFLPGISGCVEHASLSLEALRDARASHRSICLAWIDLRNAFGSIRHAHPTLPSVVPLSTSPLLTSL